MGGLGSKYLELIEITVPFYNNNFKNTIDNHQKFMFLGLGFEFNKLENKTEIVKN